MNVKDFLEPIQDMWKQYKKPFLFGIAILAGILIFISVLSTVTVFVTEVGSVPFT